jgi:RimJ/RimL family protein N-acetyltransferase
MQNEETRQPVAADAAPKEERGFAQGALVVLRPVREEDLPELARLLAENPFDREPLPWTHQRLKQKFEDKEEPGLWGKRKRYFAVVRLSGGMVGFIFEEEEWGDSTVCWNRFHVGGRLEDRDALGRDALAAYLAYKRRWNDLRRISFSIGGVEEAKAQWLRDCGFAWEITLEQAVLHQGQPVAEVIYSWVSERVLELRVDDGPVAGEATGMAEGDNTDVAGNTALPHAR